MVVVADVFENLLFLSVVADVFENLLFLSVTIHPYRSFLLTLRYRSLYDSLIRFLFRDVCPFWGWRYSGEIIRTKHSF